MSPGGIENPDFIVSYGGDGTILRTARLSAGMGIPILGINLGKVGFLAEISPDEIAHIPMKMKTGDYEILEHMAFFAEITPAGPPPTTKTSHSVVIKIT